MIAALQTEAVLKVKKLDKPVTPNLFRGLTYSALGS